MNSRAVAAPPDYKIGFVIAASSVGTIIEYYDFYLYAVLTVFLAPLFFPSENPTASLLAGFATFGAGFALRPFGAIVFGHVGDLVGRKYAFLITVTIMGLGTTLIGVLPGYAQIGVLAPTVLVLLRLLQGLAIGGEYGGAAIYVAEHAAENRRGYLTSWIQTTASMGLVLALSVILVFRLLLGQETFAAWGWRVPFLLSAFLVAIALIVRARLGETPLFSRLKAAGHSSESPVKDSLGTGRNWRLILLVLFGATAGQAVVWYQSQLPFIAVAITAATGNPLLALVYPIGIALMTFVIGSLFLKETRHIRIWDEVGGEVDAEVAQVVPGTRAAPA